MEEEKDMGLCLNEKQQRKLDQQPKREERIKKLNKRLVIIMSISIISHFILWLVIMIKKP